MISNGSLRSRDLRRQRRPECDRPADQTDLAQAWVEDDPACRQRVVVVDEAQRQLTLDCGLAGVSRDGKKAVAPFRLSVKLHATRPDLEVSFTFAGDGQWRQAAYPYVFVRDGEEVYNLYPHGEGLLVPVRRNHPDWLELPGYDLYGGVHSYLMCLGLVDLASGEGLLTLLPDIESTSLGWREVGGIVAPQVLWTPNKGAFDRPYHITWSDWFEGATTLVNWMHTLPSVADDVLIDINSQSKPADRTKALLKYLNGLAPDAPAPNTISLSLKHRIPFYSLCHHDEVIVTWRWEDGMDQPPVYWRRKNLWSVLYGAPPMYRMFAAGQAKYQEQIGQTHRYVSDWVRQIAFEAMVSHRFLTPDRTVQETEFSNGSGVVVNFGDKEYALPDGPVIKACDYVIFRRAGEKRTYHPPAGPNVFGPN